MEVREIVSQMTLEEKAGLCSGLDFWHTKGVERLSVPSIMMTDGPHGLRKQDQRGDHLGLNVSVPATCFPAGCATACSFDEALLQELGEAIGDECEAERVSMILGPSLNIKRSPLCGRNFEYFSEDPFLAGRMAAAHIRGVQSRDVAACPKHFAANSQENRRFTENSVVDERTLREIYLPAFEQAVKGADAWTVMCSYNRLNGEYTARDPRLLTEILRDEWGFSGFVVSDWGATNDRVKCLAAGLELEMPASGGHTDREIVDAVQAGRLPESALDRACERLLGIILKTRKDRAPAPENKLDAHDDLCARIAAESMVLLKNGGALPLNDESDACFIGEFFVRPRIQGGGSSHINAYRITSASDALPGVPYAKGFSIDTDQPDDALEGEALALGEKHRTIVVFAGLPDRVESEGYDREHLRLPQNQTRLMQKLIDLGKRVVVVLSNGAPIEMPWADSVSAILEGYLGGQAGGRAIADLLTGARNPCGKLAESFPMKLSDTPCYPWYNLDGDDAPYNEGLFVGYRYYDVKGMEVRFPFGHGLSYTAFEYGDLRLDKAQTDGDLTASVTVRNTGRVAGKEIVQIYVAAPNTGISRAEKELKGFAKVELAPGEAKAVQIKLDRCAFAYYNVRAARWFVEPGEYQVLAGASSRDIRLAARVTLTSSDKLPLTVTRDTLLGDLLAYPKCADMFGQIMKNAPMLNLGEDDTTGLGMMFQRMIRFMPLRSLGMMGVGPDMLPMLIAQLQALVDAE